MQRCKLLTFLPLVLIVASCSRDPKVQAQRYLENGNKFYARAKYKEASIMYRRALQKDMRFGDAYYRLGLTDLKLGSYGEAANMLRRAISLQPTNVDAITKLADLFLVASTQDAAHSGPLIQEVKDFSDKLVQLNPDSYEGHRLKGQMALLARDPATGVKELQKANSVKPFQTDLVLAYFQALVANDQFPEAEKLARDMIAKDKTYSPIYDLLYLNYMKQNKPNDGEELLKLKIQNNPQRANYLLQLATHYYYLNRRPDMDSVAQRLSNEKDFPEGHLLLGDFYFFRAREYDHAQQQYEAAIKALPKDKALYQKRLVELYATRGNNSEANQLLTGILKDNPKDNDAIAMRAALMLTTGNREQINMAANDLQSLVTKMPHNHLLRFNLARAMIAKGDVEGARLQLEEAIKIRTDLISARELLARIYLARQDYGKALKEADEIIGFDKNNLQGHLIRSSALLGMGDKDKARDELVFITKTYPQNAEARYQVGFLAWKEKDYKKSEQVFTELYKANPKDLRGLVGVIETLASENRLSDAVKAVQAAQEKEPERRDLKVALANLEVRSEHYDEAIKIWQSLIEKEPKSPDLLYRLAETERRKGDLNLAIDSFRRCSQVAPNDTSCLLQLGLLMDGTGKRDQAKPIYEQMLKIQPDHPIALNNMAFIKAEEGVDLDQALTMAQRARQALPNSPDVADTLGWIYIKKNLSENAIQIFRDLVVKDPNNPTFHYHYAMALMQKGDKPTAKKELEKALQSNPSKDEQQKIHDLLQKV